MSPLRAAGFASWILLLLLASTSLGAQTPLGALIAEQSRATFSIEGAGARAMGQGGAFIAVADDATAVSFNPAGLAQLMNPEVALSLEGSRRAFTFQGFSTTVGSRRLAVDDNSESHAKVVPRLLAFTLPMDWAGRNLVLQASAQRLLSFAESGRRRMAEFPQDPDPNFPILRRDLDLALEQRGRMDLYSLALAYEFNGRWLGGVAYHRWRGIWDLDSRNTTAEVIRIDGEPTPTVPYFIHYSQRSRVEGGNWTLGLLGRWPRFRVGLVWRTPFQASYRFSAQVAQNLFEGVDLNLPEREARLDWPHTLALGLAWKPRPNWQFSMDWSQTPWSELRIRGGGAEVDGVHFLDLRKETLVPDVTQLRAGLEYLRILSGGSVLPIRAGLFREPQPVVDPVTGQQRILEGLTLGTGLRGRRLGVDLAYRYARSRRTASRFLEVDDLLVGNLPTSKGEERLMIHRVDLSLILVVGERWDSGQLGERVAGFFRRLIRGD